MVAFGRPVADDGRAARFDNVADGAHRVTEVFRVVFPVAAAEQRHQFAVEVDFFQRREEIIPVTLRFTVVQVGIPSSRISNPSVSSLLLLAMSCTSETSSPNCFWRIFWIILAMFSVLPVSLPKKMPTVAISRITFKFK